MRTRARELALFEALSTLHPTALDLRGTLQRLSGWPHLQPVLPPAETASPEPYVWRVVDVLVAQGRVDRELFEILTERGPNRRALICAPRCRRVKSPWTLR